jgi:hypothetical protein
MIEFLDDFWSILNLIKNSFLNGLDKYLNKKFKVIVIVAEIFKIDDIIIAVLLESHVADFNSVNL